MKKTGEFDNTMIVFVSDNGASKTTIMDYAALGGEVAAHLESFDNSNANKGLPNSATDIGPAWAWAANTPFRLTKGYPTEGGMRVPCIVKMPNSLNTSPQQLDGFTYISDLMPTFLESGKSNASIRIQREGCLANPRNFTHISNWTIGSMQEREFGFEIYGMLTYRSAEWKILKLPVPYGTGEWQLYNLKNDMSEQVDLAATSPVKLKELIEKYKVYATGKWYCNTRCCCSLCKTTKIKVILTRSQSL